jgi:PAS domain S-box-containing protein
VRYVAYDDRGDDNLTEACHPSTGEGIKTPINDRSPEEIEGLLHRLELQQKELESQNRHLEQYRDRYLDLYDSAPVGYATLDTEGYVQEINLTGARLLGAERDSLTGFSLADFVAKDDQEAFLDHVRQCLHEQRDVISELTLVPRGGRSVTVQLRSIPAKPIEGEKDSHCRTVIIDITERRQMEESIRQSRAFLQTVIDSIPDPMLVIDRDHRTVLANRAACEMAGETDPVSRCLTCYWLAHQRELPCAGQNKCPLQQVVENKAPATVTHTRHNVNGEETFIEVVAAPIVNEAGEVAHIIETRRDTSERQRAVEQLQSMAQFPEENPNPILRLASDGQVLYTNRAADTLLAETCSSGSALATLRRVAEDVLRADVAREFDLECARNRIFSFLCIPLANKRYVNFYGRDITEHKRAEAALYESESRFRTMTDATPIMVWQSGADKRCDYFNKGWLEFTGRTMEQELGNGWTEGLHPDDLQPSLDAYLSAFDRREPFSLEYRLRHRSGEHRWILDRGVPRFGPDGAFLGYIGGCIDIHDRKSAEQELKVASDSAEQARAAAELANHAKDHFLAVLSHELRTPLTPVVMGVSMLQDRPDIAPEIRETLEMVRRNV